MLISAGDIASAVAMRGDDVGDGDGDNDGDGDGDNSMLMPYVSMTMMKPTSNMKTDA